MRLNPVFADLATYPFVRLQEARAAVEARGVEIIDFGVGEPREETPAFIRRALAAAVEAEPVTGYPSAVGLPERREAIATWVGRRFGAALDPDAEIVPTLGTKEAIFSLAQVIGAPGDAVAFTVPGYPVPERGARFAGQEPVALELREERGWLPDLDAVPWDRLSLLWLNTPGNPTGAVAPLEFLAEAAERCRAAGAVLACDEAYSELWFAGDPPVSALQLEDRQGVVAFNTLSKRSSMAGYRSGFVAGDPEVIAALKRFRPNTGTVPQAFVQRAAVAAWGDEARTGGHGANRGAGSRGGGMGRRGTRRGDARALPAQARGGPPRAGARRPACRGGAGVVLPVDGCRRRRRGLRHGPARAPRNRGGAGLVPRRARLRARRARAHAGGVPPGGGAAH